MYMNYFLYLNTLPEAEKNKQIIMIIIFLMIINIIIFIKALLELKKCENNNDK